MKRIPAVLCLLALPLAAAPQYKIAIVSGLHAHVWGPLKSSLHSDKVKLVGFAENLPELVAQAKKTGVPDELIFADYRKMIETTKPDFVWAFTETNRHLEVVEYCAPRGIHVIVEKPLAATMKQALEIERLARRHNIHVLANYASTWQASNYAVKSAVDSGAIGPIYRLRAVVGHGGPGDPKTSSFVAWLADPVKNGGGALVDFGCYSILWSLWMKGRPESVYASVLHLKPETYPKVEDNATLILNYKDGVSIFEGSWDLPPRAESGNEVYGRNGSIVMGRTPQLYKTGQRGPESLRVDPLPPERADAVSYMVNRLSTKQPLEGMTALGINIEVQEVLEAAKLSVKTGKAVKLAPKR